MAYLENNAFSNDSENVHTPDNPYCSDMTCWCHTNLTYHGTVTFYDPTSSRPDEQTSFAYQFLHEIYVSPFGREGA